jgi:hypothetical protein
MLLFLLFNRQAMHFKSFDTQQHCYGSLKNIIPWRDSNPGLLVPEADAMSTAPRRQGNMLTLYNTPYLSHLGPKACLQMGNKH